MEDGIVLYPAMGVGHLAPMVELAKLFLRDGFAVTVLVVDSPFDHGSSDAFIAAAASAHPFLSFHHLPPVSLPPQPPREPCHPHVRHPPSDSGPPSPRTHLSLRDLRRPCPRHRLLLHRRPRHRRRGRSPLLYLLLHQRCQPCRCPLPSNPPLCHFYQLERSRRRPDQLSRHPADPGLRYAG